MSVNPLGMLSVLMGGDSEAATYRDGSSEKNRSTSDVIDQEPPETQK